MINFERPHRRFNLLIGKWVLVSPHRGKRPWQGQVEKTPPEILPQYDPECYLCPGNKRSGGIINPKYRDTFVFDNDFSALLPPDGDEKAEDHQDHLLVAEPESGLCRVVCFSPRHDLTMPELTPESATKVIQTWSQETAELGEKEFVNYVQVFENKGAMMGCSNPHPHSQIWATGHIPDEPAAELISQEQYLNDHGSCLLCDYLGEEKAKPERVIASNDYFTALVPFWAVWPFEMLVIANRHTGSLPDLEKDEMVGLADIYQQITARYDNLFETSFPYSMGFHQTPFDGKRYPGQHLHAHFYPPLLRSATIRKFMVGFEMLGMPQRDITPEVAAERLRGLSPIHYKKTPSD